MTANFVKNKFPFLYDSSINWFPGHMQKATKVIEETLPKISTVIEIRDARVSVTLHHSLIFFSSLVQIPFSTANPSLISVTQGKRRVCSKFILTLLIRSKYEYEVKSKLK